MRRNFAQVLKEGKIDLKNEYSKFYKIFYGKDSRDDRSIADMVSDNFINYHFRGTCLSLKEFDETYGFNFVKEPQDFDEDYLINFMEYVYNFIVGLHSNYLFLNMNTHFYIQHIHKVVDMIGYMYASENSITIFVPRDNSAIAVAESELIPVDLSYKVLEYNHHSLKGNIEAKRGILVKLASILEAQDKKLNSINQSFKSDLFQLLNSCNIRHNNKDESSKQYKKYVAEISEAELEYIYDEIYQMCLLAFMQLEHADRKEWLDEIKSNINNVK